MRPPRIATWLLLAFGSRSDAHIIAGDLEEQYPRHSRAWYWRQVTYTIAMGVIHDLRDHWVLALRALVVGFVVMTVASMSTATLGYWLLPRVLPTPINPSSLPTWLWILGLPAAGAGWAIARLHPRHAAPFAMIFAIAAIQYQLMPRLLFLIRNSLEHERFRPYLWGYLANAPFVILIIGLGVMLGAMAGSRSGIAKIMHD